jgi:hypothetical protein
MLVLAHALLAIGQLIVASAHDLAMGVLGLSVCGAATLSSIRDGARRPRWFPRKHARHGDERQADRRARGVSPPPCSQPPGAADWRALIAAMAIVTIVAGAGYFALRVAAGTAEFPPPDSATFSRCCACRARVVQRRRVLLRDRAKRRTSPGSCCCARDAMAASARARNPPPVSRGLRPPTAHVASGDRRVLLGI